MYTLILTVCWTLSGECEVLRYENLRDERACWYLAAEKNRELKKDGVDFVLARCLEGIEL